MPAMNMQKKPARQSELVPDLTDFMNDDWFFGSAHKEVKAYNMTGMTPLEFEGDKGCRNSNSKMTQEWLEEARRVIASSPSRFESPTRRSGSPRFAAAAKNVLDRRDPFSRSARRQRGRDGISGEILSQHNRNKSESFGTTAAASPVAQWFDKVDAKSNSQGDCDGKNIKTTSTRKSRFQDKPNGENASTTPAKATARRTAKFEQETKQDRPFMLSPPKQLIQSAHRRSISSSTCSFSKLYKSQQPGNEKDGLAEIEKADIRLVDEVGRLNLFLKEQRVMMGKISRGEVDTKAKIVLSTTPNSTSSMVAAICYALLLEKKERRDGKASVVPVINIKRGRMWKHTQAAWLLYYVGIDATSLLFSDEVDLEELLMSRQSSILAVGQDVLHTNGEVGSQCTVLTDNYCEDAYDLLQTPYIKKLLLAGILSDTDNLNLASKSCTNRDAEAVQLLLVGCSTNLRHELHEQLMQDQRRDNAFLEAMQFNYGTCTHDNTNHTDESNERRESKTIFSESANAANQQITFPSAMENRETRIRRPKTSENLNNNADKKYQFPPAGTTSTYSEEPLVYRSKNKFFLAKWFGFGSK